MRALTVQPGHAHSIKLEDVPLPSEEDGAMLVRALALGICGTDREIIAGDYGWQPPGQQRLILGHESLGRVEQAPSDCGVAPGDLVVGVVRRPDPLPCPACAAGEWDMCHNGQYTERGIKQRDGYGSEWFRIDPAYVVKVDWKLDRLGVLLEPASIVAKAWQQSLAIGSRSPSWRPRTALITGAGPIGLLAAMMGVQRRLDVHVLDRNDDGLKPALVHALGGTYHSGALGNLRADIVIECTGADPVVLDVLQRACPPGVVCMAGVSAGGHKTAFDVGHFNRRLVLENQAVFGTVNANLGHYRAAAAALAKADKNWLARLITRRVPLSQWREAFTHRDDDIKVVIDFSS
jgi:threonine dehydrogenase-like Zn-dependent dehydrogenase